MNRHRRSLSAHQPSRRPATGRPSSFALRPFALSTCVLSLALVALATPARAFDATSVTLLSQAWPAGTESRIDDIGRGVGVVFSPDLSVRNNCRFYEALGFSCFQDANWENVLDALHRHNVLYPENRIHTLILETHGTNGNGAKLQISYTPTADRSYISAGALQQRLEPEGIDYVIISACNSGRLLRPEIYARLDPYNGDKLFLPPTCGIVDATEDFDAGRNSVTIVRPAESHIETTLVGRLAELAPATRRALLASAKAKGIKLPKEFAVSDLMVQMLTRDPRLRLVANSSVEEMSKEILTQDRSEANFKHFVSYLNRVSLHDSRGAAVPTAKTAAKRKKGAAGLKRAAR
jgi:hypothetical protein